MRVAIAGIAREGSAFRFTFDGQPIEAHPGESIAAALIAAGVWRFRTARDGAPRGVFCGMGVCGECQVHIGAESRRACLEAARAGIEVAHSAFDVPVAPVDRVSAPAEWPALRPDVLVVGAGPAGLAAARVAAGAGLAVHLVDERAKAGGQYFKQPAEGFTVDEGALDTQFREGRALHAAALAAGVRFTFGATAWGAASPGTVMISVDGRSSAITPRRLVLATGAYEHVAPFPGWTLPGVLTTGAAQTLLRAHQIAPGRRILVAGNGPLNVQVAHELTRAGAHVVAVAERAAPPFRAPSNAIARLVLTGPALARNGVAHLRALRAARVPIHYRHALIAVEGSARAERAVLAALGADGSVLPGTEVTVDVDAVCVSDGFRPQSELARALGCRFQADAGGGLVAQRDDCGRTNLAHVFLAGDAGGLGGARIAVVQGMLAGHEIATDLTGSADRSEVRALRRQLHRHRTFQHALWRIFAAPRPAVELAGADTLICRCESVDRQTLERALAQHGGSLGALKRATRLGMGRCQGRYCTTSAAALIRAQLGVEPAADDLFAPRAPCKPVPVGEIAGRYGVEPPAVDVLRTSGRSANSQV